MIKIAVVGAGGMGKTHIDNLTAMPGVKLCDLCDPREESKALAASLSAGHYDCLEAMLAASAAEVYLVCTPTFLHVPHIRAILSAKKHCIAEKPLCLSALEGEKLFQLAQANGVQLHVAQVVRFFEEYALAAAIVKSGRYGRLRDAHLCRLSEKPRWTAGNWMFERDKSGLIPYDLHIHEIDFLVSLLGVPQVQSVQKGEQEGCSDYYRILYRFGSVTACAEASWYRAPFPFQQSYRLYFERAVLHYDGSACVLYETGQEPRVLPTESAVEKKATSINVGATNAYSLELAHFLDCIRERRSSEQVPPEQVIQVLRVLEAIR